MAEAAAAQGNRENVLGYLRQAVQAQPMQWEPHYFLGVELAARNEIPEASRHFGEVVRLRPDYALGHFNYRIALAKAGKINDAIAQLNETVRLGPGNAQAAQYLRALRPR